MKRYVSLSVHRDIGAPFVLLFAVIALLGLLAALFVPRRRLWVKAVSTGPGELTFEYAGLARGEDPAIAVAVEGLQREHQRALDAEGWPAQGSTPTAPSDPAATPSSASTTTPDDANLPA